MPIDITKETVITPAKVTRLCPERRKGVRPNPATVWRWMMQGVNGIRLESIMIGATRCTSVEAVQRFFDALTAADDAKHNSPPTITVSREKAIAAAERRLAGRSNAVVPRTC